MEDQTIHPGDGRFNVGVSIVVVPNGLTEDGSTALLSLSLAPVPRDAREAVAVVDVRYWPERVGLLAENIRILFSALSPADTSASPMCKVDSALKHLDKQATVQWRNIFKTKLGFDAGFEDLLRALDKGTDEAAKKPPPTTPPNSTVSLLIDDLYGAFVATNLARRVADRIRSEAGPVRELLALETATPSRNWWKMVADKWLVERKDNELYANGPEAALVSFGPRVDDSFNREEYSDAPSIMKRDVVRFPRLSDQTAWSPHPDTKLYHHDFWLGGIVSKDETLASEAVREVLASHTFQRKPRPTPRPRLQYVQQQQNANPPLADASDLALRKYSGLLSYPTLAKYFRLIIDVTVSVAETHLRPEGGASDFHVSGTVTGCLSEVEQTNRVDSARSNLGGLYVLKHPKNPDLIWTAFTLALHQNKPSYFGPLAEGREKDQAIGKFSDGLLLLSSDPSRFKLHTLDITNAIVRLADSAKLTKEQTTQEKGRPLPDLVSRGIVLHDTKACDAQIQRNDRMAQRSRLNSKGQSWRVLYAEDLTLGYRIDVAMLKLNDIKGESYRNPERWRSLTARTVGYGRDISKANCSLLRGRQSIERDDGHVRPMTRANDPKHPEQGPSVAHSELFTWTGDSLSVPHVDEEQLRYASSQASRTKTVTNGLPVQDGDLNVDIVYNLPVRSEGPHRQLMPLREGRSYVFGARVQFINGCSVAFKDAVRRYTGEERSLLLGDNGVSPYVYRRRACVHAPEILLPWMADYVTAKSDAELRLNTPGETILDLVVRSGHLNTDRCWRFLVPPRVTFDLAEQAGVFDCDKAAKPEGAFTRTIRARFDQALGVFPIARAGRIENAVVFRPRDACATGLAKTVDGQHKEKTRGSVLVLDQGAKPPSQKYYPDPMARKFGACFVVEPGYAPLFGSESKPVQFWAANGDPRDAIPVVIQLKKGRRGERGDLLGWFDQGNATVQVVPVNATESIRLRALTVVLVPGASIELDLFSIPDGSEVSKHHCLAQALSSLREARDRGGIYNVADLGLTGSASISFHNIVARLVSDDHAVSGSACDEILAQGSLSPLTTKRTIRLVHAVDLPAVPKFGGASDSPFGNVRLFPITIAALNGNVVKEDVANRQPAEPESKLKKAWESYVLSKKIKDKAEWVDRKLWDSQQGGMTTFFAGEVYVDRLTTGKLRCDAYWKEYNPSSLRKIAGNWKLDAKVLNRYAHLFEINDIESYVTKHSSNVARPRGHGTDLDQLDLCWLSSQQLRYLAFPFVDGRARKLHLELTATSRYAEYFPRNTTTQINSLAGRRIEQSESIAWLTAVFRPSPPEVDRILPLFRWTKETHDGGDLLLWKRESSLRVYMGRDWYSTGEGEKLALACWPQELFGDQKTWAPIVNRLGMESLDTFRLSDKPSSMNSNEFHRYGQYVTRWGADPIHLSAGLDSLISSDRFSGFSETASKGLLNNDLLLTLPTTDIRGNQEESKSLSVCVVAYDVVIDAHEGKYYADIAIDPGGSYFPFVQLGLVRYQAHAVSGLELSHPVAMFAQLPPKREGTVRFKDDLVVDVEVSGVGFHRSKLYTTDQEKSDYVKEKYKTVNGGEVRSSQLDRADLEDGKYSEERYKTDYPHMEFKLMRAADPGSFPSNGDRINWQPVVDGHGRMMEWGLHPIQRGPDLLWKLSIKLPSSRRHRQFALLIEEFEWMAMDVVSEPEQEAGVPVFTTKMVKRGPVFSHIIDLRAC